MGRMGVHDPPPPPWTITQSGDHWEGPAWDTHPGGSYEWLPPAAPPPWPPAAEPRGLRRSLAGLVAAVLVLGAAAAGITYGFTKFAATGTTPLGGESTVVDITSSLADGNSAAGTGMIITSSGEVLTNNHVVENSQSVSVQIGGAGTVYDAAILGVDPADDIALLKLPNVSGLQTVHVGDSSRVAVGDSVTAVGNALGRGGTPVSTRGSVTALGQSITASDPSGTNVETLNDMIQFNASIEPGDSGGPLVNTSGQVIGMDTAASGRVRDRQLGSNVAFAIPINTAISVAQKISSGTPSPNIRTAHGAFLGVDVRNSSSPAGALVVGVQPNTPADSAGIAAQDVIVAVNGTAVASVESLQSALRAHKPGDHVRIRWIDGSGQQQNATVQLASGPTP